MMMSSSFGEIQLGLDMEIEILKRLSPESLVRFMSVSKYWKSVIQSSRFISGYNQTFSNLFFVGFYGRRNYAVIKEKQKRIFGDYICTQQGLSLPHSHDDDFRRFQPYSLIGYSQGLFAFSNRKDRLVIWNPSIRKSLFIPFPPDLRWPYYDHICFTVVCNATEPTIFCITEETPLRLQIYTLTTGAWRTVSNTPPCISLKFRGARVVTDRFIYWIAYYNTAPEVYLILSFDITSEQFTELCLPPTLASSSRIDDLELSKLRESLVVLKIDESKEEIGVWMMEPGGVDNSFTKQFTINLPTDIPNLQRHREVNVLGFTIDGQIILQMEICYEQWKLLFYQPDSKSFLNIGKSQKKKSYLAGSYMETLLLLDH